jgi:hypothetical protein
MSDRPITTSAPPPSVSIPASRRDISWREVVAAGCIGVVLAIVVNWPLSHRLGSSFPRDQRDPSLQSWQLAWDGHALVHQPLDFWDTNAFWPTGNDLAFSDALIGYAPAGLIGSGPEAALLRHNILFLFAYAFAFVGAYLFARELGVGPVAAAVAGAAFAYAPWRLEQTSHLQVLSSGGIPLALFLLLRGYRRSRFRYIVGGWAVAAWQITLGPTLGIQLAYLLGILFLMWVCWWLWKRRPSLDKVVVRASLVGMAIFAVVVGWEAIAYLQGAADHPESARLVKEVTFYSPPPSAFLAASPLNLIWGSTTESMRESLEWYQEQVQFPGLLVVLFAIAGVIGSVFPLRRRLVLAFAVVGVAVLSMGFHFVGGKFGYSFLFHHVPGWDGVRTPNRLNTLTSLGLGLLASAGVQWVMDLWSRRSTRSPHKVVRTLPIACGVIVAGLIVLEGAGRMVTVEPPDAPAALSSLEPPIFHLPSDDFNDATYMLWSTDGFPPIANGISGFVTESLTNLRTTAEAFPDAASVEALRDYGIRTVVAHPSMLPGTRYQEVPNRSVEGLGIEVRVAEGLLVYDLGP